MKRISQALLHPKNNLRAVAILLVFVWLGWIFIVSLRHPPLGINEQEFKPPAANETVALARLDIGMHIESITNFNAVENTFQANGALWAKWDPEADLIINNQPFASLYFSNGIKGESIMNHFIPERPFQTKSGSYYQYVEFSGDFKNSQIDYSRYPFQDVELSIKVESHAYDVEELTISPLGEESGFSESIEISGYRPEAIKSQSLVRHYSTSWGLGDDKKGSLPQINDEADLSNYSIAEFKLLFRRNIWTGVIRQLFPLLIIISIAILSLSLPASLPARVSISPSLLLGLLFLDGRQISLTPVYADGWTYLSKLLLCGYGILFYTFFEAIKGQRLRSDREIEAFEAKSIIKSVILAFILLITSLL